MSETQRFLALARDLGVTIVGIGDVRHHLLGNESFPHHHRSQIFTPYDERTPDNFPDVPLEDSGVPVAWVLARRAGIYKGCGNTGQAQADTTGLEDGVWVLLLNGEWGRVS